MTLRSRIDRLEGKQSNDSEPLPCPDCPRLVFLENGEDPASLPMECHKCGRKWPPDRIRYVEVASSDPRS